jgi:hypothetical protein
MRLPRWVGGTRGAVQLIGLMAAAGLAGLAGLAYSDANGSWQNAVRLEEARSAARQEQARLVYENEAPPTARIILDEQIAIKLSRVGPRNRLAITQRAASSNTAAAMRGAYLKKAPGSLADRRYRTDSGGADVIARLRTLLAADAAEKPPPNPTAEVRAGNAAAVRGGWYGAGAVVLSLIPALLAWRRRGRHRIEAPAAELIPQAGQEEGARRRRVAVIALALWLLAAVVPMSQLALGAEEQRSQGAAARIAAVVTADIAASMARTQFAAQAVQTARELGVRAEGRRMGAVGAAPETAAQERAVADAEDLAATDAETIVAAMTRAPVAADGLDPRLVAALTSEKADWDAGLAAEHAEADRSSRWGDRSNAAVIAGALLAMVLYAMDLIRERITG